MIQRIDRWIDRLQVSARPLMDVVGVVWIATMCIACVWAGVVVLGKAALMVVGK